MTKKLFNVITSTFADSFYLHWQNNTHTTPVCIFAASSVVNSSVFLSLYVDVGYAFSLLLQYQIFFLASKHCLNLECILLTSISGPLVPQISYLINFSEYILDVLSIDETAGTVFNGFRVLPK